MKTRTITIHKDQVYKQINAITYKFRDAMAEGLSPRSGNAIESDTDEDVDGRLIARYVDLRYARLMKRLMFCLLPEIIEDADNTIEVTEDYIFNLNLKDDFLDSMLHPIATYIHEYLIRGALFDWYASMGSNEASAYADASDLENDIVGLLRGKSAVQAPLQPFGPRHKIF